MIGFLCKKLQPLLSNGRVWADSSHTQLSIRHNKSYIRSYSSHMPTAKKNFVVSYLVNSCGLSSESALLASREINFSNTDGPNSVVAFFRENGFTPSQISTIIRKCPRLLGLNPEKILLPNIEFFYSTGMSSVQLTDLFCSTPAILTYPLENKIIPWYNFLKSVVLLDEKVITTLKETLYLGDLTKEFAPNVKFLRKLGVPQSHLTRLVSRHPAALLLKCDKFNVTVAKVIEMGFNPLRLTFINAIRVLSLMKCSTFECKVDAYRRCGWADNEIELAFRIEPLFMTLSVKKIQKMMDFLVKTMGWEPASIARDPIVLLYSLEKRIIPRCSVIEVLMLRGLVKKELNLGNFLKYSEKDFLGKFVTKYEADVPQLLSIYEGKMGTS